MIRELQKLSHIELLSLSKSACVPQLINSLHKGQCGRICVVGGSQDYTGAPFFSAHAAALTGADMVHVLCELRAATAIKSYSPNLMVHPYLRDSHSVQKGLKMPIDEVHSLLDRVDVLVVGPGLGRDPEMLSSILEILDYVATEHKGDKPVILDADGLYLVHHSDYATKMKEVLERFAPARVIMTPNVVEAKRICEKLSLGSPQEIAEHFKCIALLKGGADFILYDGVCIKNKCQGSPRRVGGQGDTLTGCTAALLAGAIAINERKVTRGINAPPSYEPRAWPELAMLASYLGCTLTREAAKHAFEMHGRSMQTSDLNGSVARAVRTVVGGGQ